MDAQPVMSKDQVKIMEEYLVVQEFRNSFKKKFGYEPLIFTRNIKGKTIDSLPFMSLEQITEYFYPFLPTGNKTKIPLDTKLRNRSITELRYIFFRITRSMGYSLKEIGQHAGKKDHTTVLHGLKMFTNLYQTDEMFREKFTMIVNYIKENTNESPIMENVNQLPDQSKSDLFPILLPK